MIHRDIIYRALGERLKSLREKKHLTQEALSNRLNVSRASVANYESGKQALAIIDIYKLADEFNIDITDILPRLSEIRSLSITPEKKLELANNLEEEKRKELEEFLRTLPTKKG